MNRQYLPISVVLCTVALAMACSKQAPSPAAPSTTPGPAISNVSAAADGSTLKATPPIPQSPINGTKPEGAQVVLVVSNGKTEFADGIPLSYRFEILTQGGTKVYDFGGVAPGSSTTSHSVRGAQLEIDQTYQWRARTEYNGLVGPWSPLATFVAPATRGYMNGNELYDPLVNGETIGTTHGDVTFIPGLGIRLNSQLAYVHYELPETLHEGEFSILVTNLRTNTEGSKTKIFAMAEGYADIVTNDRRATVEKRGNPAGVIAWRFIAHGGAAETVGNEREPRSFSPDLDYLWEMSWRNNFFRVRVVEGGVNGRVIYEKGKGFPGRPYDPDPHVIFLGSPVGRSGPDGASVDGMIVRQVWVSGRPRPDFAN
jgi:hypothetical protein